MRHFRFLLLSLAVLSMTFIYGNRVAFGFTVICQQGNVNESDTFTPVNSDYYLTNSLNVAWMFSATAVGMCVGPLPFYFPNLLTTPMLIFGYGLIATISALFYPLADSLGFWPSLICRFLSGFANASQLHFTNDMVLRWTPDSEASFFFSIMLATSQLAPLITMILGAEMCSLPFLGWEGTYYVIGVLTFVTSTAFAYFYSDSVQDNKFCEPSEKELILSGKKVKNENDPVPHRELFTDGTIWISLIMFTGYYLAMIVYQQYSPIFIKQVLHFSIRQTGYFSAIPQIIGIVIKVGGGKLLDYNFGCGRKWTLAIPLIILEFLSASSLFLTGFLNDRTLALFFMMSFASCHFFVPVICSRTIQIRAAHHAHFALNLNMIIAGIAQMIIPLGVTAAVPDNSREQWSHLFYFLSASIVVSTVAYTIFARTTAAPWAERTENLDNEAYEPEEESIEVQRSASHEKY